MSYQVKLIHFIMSYIPEKKITKLVEQYLLTKTSVIENHHN